MPRKKKQDYGHLIDNRKFLVKDPKCDSFFLPVVSRRLPRGKKSGRFLIKCGDGCPQKLEVHFGFTDSMVEINGVAASLTAWEKLFVEVFAYIREGQE